MVGLRSGGEVSDQVTLPESTTELFHYALADTKSPSGSYSVNWDDMLGLHWLDPGAPQFTSGWKYHFVRNLFLSG